LIPEYIIPEYDNGAADKWNHDGERKAIVKAEDWEGPKFEVCANMASVCRAFPLESSRRHELLSFGHHKEVAALPPEQQDHWRPLRFNT
jgi:hypothetical protein